jgi:hypothetical protein
MRLIRNPIALAVAIALATLGWLALRPLPGLDAAGERAPAASAPAKSSVASAPAGGSAAGPAPVPRSPVSSVPRVPVAPTTVYGEFLQAKQYRAIYDRLKSSAEGETAEGRLVLWEILRNCATITEGRRYNYRSPVPKRDDFLATLAAGDPTRDQRIAAFDDFTANRCVGFEGVAITQADLDRVLQASASAGDPRARALSLEQDLWNQRRSQGRDNVALSDASIDTIKQVIATKDPEAIRVAGRMLANTWADTTLRIGADQQPVDPRAFMNAWLVLACEYGQPCGADTPRMQQACALQGHCNAQTWPDYLYYYAASPYDSQMLANYRAILRTAIDTGDWSQLTVVRGLPTPTGRTTFLPGPR